MVKNLPAVQETWVRKAPWRKGMATHPSILAWEIPRTEEPGGQEPTESLRVSHDWAQRRQWQATAVLLPGKSHGWRSLVGCSPWATMSWTRLSDFTFTFHFHALEKEKATHSSVLAWRIPGTGEPGGLLSMGSHRARHGWSDLAAAAAAAAAGLSD